MAAFYLRTAQGEAVHPRSAAEREVLVAEPASFQAQLRTAESSITKPEMVAPEIPSVLGLAATEVMVAGSLLKTLHWSIPSFTGTRPATDPEFGSVEESQEMVGKEAVFSCRVEVR